MQQLSEQLESNLDAAVAQVLDSCVTLRRHLHAHPEPSGEELQTSLHLYQLLGELPAEVRMGPEGCGVIADGGGDSERRIALRADIDALRIHDRKQTDYRSQNEGVMHACGHDAHTAMVYGAAATLTALAEAKRLPWPVPWRTILQPAEETATGARQMVAAGAVEGVDAVLGLHVDPARDVGEIGIREGALTAHCESVHVEIAGQGGHAARPHESRDPIAAAAQFINSVYQFIPRTTDSLDAVVVTFGRIEGGMAANVIPDSVVVDGTVRTLDCRVRQQTLEQIRRIASGVSELTGTEIRLDFRASIPSVLNDPRVTRVVCQAAEQVVGPDGLHIIARPSMGSEDFACYLEHAPGSMFRLGTARPDAPPTPLHTPEFDIDESALAVGVRVLTRSAIVLAQPGQ